MPDNLTLQGATWQNGTYTGGQWVAGCGCGGKPRVPVEVPAGSKAVQLRLVGRHVGPVTQINYDMMPHQVAIDIAEADADHWLQSGVATLPRQGVKGRTARAPSETT